MHCSLCCLLRLMAILGVLGSTSVAVAADDNEETSDEEIAGLVENVTQGTTTERREATDKLLKLGERAVAPLSVAAETEVKEQANACFDVLARLRASDDEKTADAAKKSLERLSESDIPNVARRAKTVLRLNQFLRLQGAGAVPPGPNVIQNFQFGGGQQKSVQMT